MATLKEWEDYFKTLSTERREELRKALVVLEGDPMILKELGWTGMFALSITLDWLNKGAKPVGQPHGLGPAIYRGFLLEVRGDEIWAFRNSMMKDGNSPSYRERDVDGLEIMIDQCNDHGDYKESYLQEY